MGDNTTDSSPETKTLKKRPDVGVIMVGADGLLFYDLENVDDEWISARNAVDLRDWA